MTSPSQATPLTSSGKTTRTAKVMALSLGSGLSMLASLVAGMVAARWLSKHDYATVRQTFLAYDFASPLLMLGLPNALYYFLPREQNAKRGVIVDNMALLMGGGLLFSLFILCGGYHLLALRFDNPDLRHTLPWLAPYPLLVMTVAGLAAVLVVADRTHTLAVYNVISSLILTVGGIVAVLATRSYMAPVLVRIAISAILLPVAVLLMFRAFHGSLRWPNPTSMWSMLCYSVPLGLASMLGSITLQLHSIIVAALSSPEDFAVYINGAMEIPLIGVVTGSITTVVFAEMADLCAQGRRPEALRLFHTACLRSACILFPTMCFLLVAANPFITLLYSEQYRESVLPFTIYLFVLPVRVVVYGAALMALGMTRVVLMRSVLDLSINASLCFVLVHAFGYLGAAFATVMTLYGWTIPYNLVKIGQGFEVSWRKVLPFGGLAKILAVCMAGMPIAAIGIRAIPSMPLGCLGLAAILYGPLVAFLLYRTSVLVLPSWLQAMIPVCLRTRA